MPLGAACLLSDACLDPGAAVSQINRTTGISPDSWRGDYCQSAGRFDLPSRRCACNVLNWKGDSPRDWTGERQAGVQVLLKIQFGQNFGF